MAGQRMVKIGSRDILLGGRQRLRPGRIRQVRELTALHSFLLVAQREHFRYSAWLSHSRSDFAQGRHCIRPQRCGQRRKNTGIREAYNSLHCSRSWARVSACARARREGSGAVAGLLVGRRVSVLAVDRSSSIVVLWFGPLMLLERPWCCSQVPTGSPSHQN